MGMWSVNHLQRGGGLHEEGEGGSTKRGRGGLTKGVDAQIGGGGGWRACIMAGCACTNGEGRS